MIVIPREGYLQIALLIRKGSDAQLRRRGLAAFHADVLELLPEAGDTVSAVASLDDVKCLDVKLNRLRHWHTDGLLLIGDAAHAMSPAGGVGINMAVQDGVATARLLAGPLRRGAASERDLKRVRRRRIVATALTQALQRQLDARLLGPVVRGEDGASGPPAGLLWAVQRGRGCRRSRPMWWAWGVRPERAPDFARRAAGQR